MSLINDALKKARSQSAMPTEPVESVSAAHTGSRKNFGGRRESPSFVSWMIVTAVITVLAVTCAILAMVLFYQSSAAESIAEQPVSESVVSPMQSQPATAPLPLIAEPELLPMPKGDGSKSAAVDDLPVDQEDAPSMPTTATQPQVDSPAVLRAPSAADRIETLADGYAPSEAAVHWLAESTISGVRLAGQQSRVMLNGRTYRIGETVHFELGIVVRAIQENRVLFEDALGVRYVKHF
jgi:hypothetical protein